MFSRNHRNIDKHRDRLEQSFKDLVAGAEDLLRSTADDSEEAMHGARHRLKRRLAEARGTAREWEDLALARTGRAARAADEYVHDHAWKSLGVVAVAGIAIGCLIAAACLSDRR